MLLMNNITMLLLTSGLSGGFGSFIPSFAQILLAVLVIGERNNIPTYITLACVYEQGDISMCFFFFC